MAKISRADYATSSSERFTYALFYFGQLIFYMIVTSFINLFFTEIGIPATIVGGVLIVTKVWDAINDPIFGVIVDKVNLKRGKYIPWVRIATFLIPITTILIFCIPSGLSAQVKIILAVATYVLWDTAYTICDVPIYALPTAMTSNIDERDRLYINSKFFAFLGGLITVIAVPLLYPAIGWTMAVVILAVLGFLTMLPLTFKARERFFVKEEHNPSLVELLRYVIRNKYLLIYHGTLILVALSNTASPVQSYVAIHCLGGTEYIAMIALIATVPMLFAVFFAKFLLDRADKVFIAISCMLGSMTIGVIMYFVGYGSLVLFSILIAFRALFGGMSVVLVAMFTADCSEYGNYITGERAQGVTFAIQTFTAKMTAALSVSIGMFILGAIGFVEGSGVAQDASVVSAIWVLYTLVPLATGILSVFLLGFAYRLRQKDVAVMIRVNKGELAREEAAAMMSRKY